MEQIFDICPSFVSCDVELGRVSVQFMLLQLQLYSLGGSGVGSRPSVPYGANFIIINVYYTHHSSVMYFHLFHQCSQLPGKPCLGNNQLPLYVEWDG